MRAWAKMIGLVAVALLVAEFIVGRPLHRVPPGEPAPDFALQDLSGRQVALKGLRGQVVALNFWASWCAPCRYEMPDLAEVWRRNHDRCFEILGVAEQSGGDDEVRAASQLFGIPYPVLNDRSGAVADLFKVPGFPRTYLIDTEGRIREVFDGALSREELERVIAPLLPVSAGACPRT